MHDGDIFRFARSRRHNRRPPRIARGVECRFRFGDGSGLVRLQQHGVTRAGACNAVLLKPNQAGTITETKAALDAARDAGWSSIVSARSGETEDVTIVHLAVGWAAGQLKVGACARGRKSVG